MTLIMVIKREGINQNDLKNPFPFKGGNVDLQ